MMGDVVVVVDLVGRKERGGHFAPMIKLNPLSVLRVYNTGCDGFMCNIYTAHILYST